MEAVDAVGAVGVTDSTWPVRASRTTVSGRPAVRDAPSCAPDVTVLACAGAAAARTAANPATIAVAIRAVNLMGVSSGGRLPGQNRGSQLRSRPSVVVVDVERVAAAVPRRVDDVRGRCGQPHRVLEGLVRGETGECGRRSAPCLRGEVRG